jgi:hypothetical protein
MEYLSELARIDFVRVAAKSKSPQHRIGERAEKQGSAVEARS